MGKTSGTSFSKTDILALFQEVGARLAEREVFAEVAICGSVAMMLQFEPTREAHDVDYFAVEEDPYELSEVVADIAIERSLPEDWFNNAVSFYESGSPGLVPFGDFPMFGEGGLRVFVATPHYMLAMKVLGHMHNLKDVWRLADETGITDVGGIERVLQQFYPGERLEARNRAIVSDMFEAKQRGEAFDPMLAW